MIQSRPDINASQVLAGVNFMAGIHFNETRQAGGYGLGRLAGAAPRARPTLVQAANNNRRVNWGGRTRLGTCQR